MENDTPALGVSTHEGEVEVLGEPLKVVTLEGESVRVSDTDTEGDPEVVNDTGAVNVPLLALVGVG